MTDHNLEEQLGAMLTRRADDIKVAAPIDFSSTRKAPIRLKSGPYLVAATVAAVVIAAGGTVVGIRSIPHGSQANPAASKAGTQPPTPSSRPTTCAEVRARLTWKTPIDNGTKVVLDHPQNQVVSTNGSIGEYLLLQTTRSSPQSAAVYGQATLAVFHGGDGQDIAVLPTGSTEIPVVDPAGAITADWIAYGYSRPQNENAYYKVLLYDRHTGATRTVAELDDSAVRDNQLFSAPPVIFGSTLYWIQTVYDDPSKSVLKSYDLSSGTYGSTPVPGASSLVYYGTGVATISGDGSNSTFTTKLGASLPSRVVQAMRGATAFMYNAPAAGTAGSGRLHWIRTIVDRGKSTPAYYTYDVGDEGFSYAEIADYSFDLTVGTDPFAAISPITGGPNEALEDRELKGGPHPLPEGDVLQATVGDTAIFGTGSTKSGSSGLVLVKISSLPQLTAGC